AGEHSQDRPRGNVGGGPRGMSAELDIPILWEVADVARYLNCSEQRVRDYIYQHGLTPHGRRGPLGPYVFTRELVDDWLAACLKSQPERPCGASSPVTGHSHGAHHAENKRQTARTG